MANIFKATENDFLDGSGEFADMQDIVENYWGSSEEERYFPIAFWKLNQLINNSPSEQAAFRVFDFDNRALVHAEWVSFDEEYEELIANNEQDNEYYFVLHKSEFEAMREAIDITVVPLNRVVVLGRLGEATPDGFDFTAFLVAAGTTISGSGSSGEGASTGIRIPPGGNE